MFREKQRRKDEGAHASSHILHVEKVARVQRCWVGTDVLAWGARDPYIEAFAHIKFEQFTEWIL